MSQLFFCMGLREVGPADSSLWMLLSPTFTILGGLFIGNESKKLLKVSFRQIVGLSVSFLGVIGLICY